MPRLPQTPQLLRSSACSRTCSPFASSRGLRTRTARPIAALAAPRQIPDHPRGRGLRLRILFAVSPLREHLQAAQPHRRAAVVAVLQNRAAQRHRIALRKNRQRQFAPILRNRPRLRPLPVAAASCHIGRAARRSMVIAANAGLTLLGWRKRHGRKRPPRKRKYKLFFCAHTSLTFLLHSYGQKARRRRLLGLSPSRQTCHAPGVRSIATTPVST